MWLSRLKSLVDSILFRLSLQQSFALFAGFRYNNIRNYSAKIF
ncbi:MAG: hypothetical protein HW390_2678 [Candidatus Brocadiaceae bacterium]|nr:hypothetical protein [Candidatus Brocadiaceae bacterium]